MDHGAHSSRERADRRAVRAALLINLTVAASAFAGAAVTGSGALLAGGALVLADAAGQVAQRVSAHRHRAPRRVVAPPHPSGLHRERFFWPFTVTGALLLLGGTVLVDAGAHRLPRPAPLTDPAIAAAVAGAAVVLKGASLARAALAVHRQVTASGPSSGIRWWRHLVRPTRPEPVLLLRQEAPATPALVVAAGAVAATAVTDDPRFDAVGMTAVGVLMLLAAVTHAVQMRWLLVGSPASAADREAVTAAVQIEPGVVRLVHLEAHHLGPEELLVAAKVELIPGLDVAEVVDVARRLEAGIRRAVPSAGAVYIEPDLCRTGLAGPAEGRSSGPATNGPRLQPA